MTIRWLVAALTLGWLWLMVRGMEVIADALHARWPRWFD